MIPLRIPRRIKHMIPLRIRTRRSPWSSGASSARTKLTTRICVEDFPTHGREREREREIVRRGLIQQVQLWWRGPLPYIGG